MLNWRIPQTKRHFYYLRWSLIIIRQLRFVAFSVLWELCDRASSLQQWLENYFYILAFPSPAIKMRVESWCLLLAACCVLTTEAARKTSRKLKRDETESLKSFEDVDDDGENDEDAEPCQCGVFMSQQVGIKEGRRGRPRGAPKGEPVVTYDTDEPSLPCGSIGFKHCINKCVDVILKYLPRAGPVICGAVERDVHRERAYLFVRNCDSQWTPTNFSAGKEFCCTDGQHHKC